MSLFDPTAPLRGLLVSLVGAAALFAGGFVYRWSGEEERYLARFRAEVALSHADFVKRDTRARAQEQFVLHQLETSRVAYLTKTVPQIEWLVETVEVLRNVCLPPAAVRVWDAANADRHLDLQQAGVDRPVPQDAPTDP